MNHGMEIDLKNNFKKTFLGGCRKGGERTHGQQCRDDGDRVGWRWKRA